MTQEQIIAEARYERAAKIVRYAHASGITSLAGMTDAEWFALWAGALGSGARCPSDETRELVRFALTCSEAQP